MHLLYTLLGSSGQRFRIKKPELSLSISSSFLLKRWFIFAWDDKNNQSLDLQKKIILVYENSSKFQITIKFPNNWRLNSLQPTRFWDNLLQAFFQIKISVTWRLMVKNDKIYSKQRPKIVKDEKRRGKSAIAWHLCSTSTKITESQPFLCLLPKINNYWMRFLWYPE